MTLKAEKLAELLEGLLESGAGKRDEAIRAFQQAIWGTEDAIVNPAVDEIVRDLAYDLDFYVADSSHRREDPSYYGDDRLEREIRDALRKVRDAGVTLNPKDLE